MIVYRVCTQEEYESLVNGIAVSELGAYFDFDTSLLNDHKYNNDEKYLHFFGEMGNIVFLGTLKDHYLCYYDIPNDLLDNNKGIGYYNEPGVIVKRFNIEEYAIPSNLIKFEYLVGIAKIEQEIELDDYLDDPSLGSFLEHKCLKDLDNKLVKVIK